MTDIDKTAVRDAATVIVLRDADRPHVLMGQRGKTAAFMPDKFVFPGGAVDAGDADVPLARPLPPLCAERLVRGVRPRHRPCRLPPRRCASCGRRRVWRLVSPGRGRGRCRRIGHGLPRAPRAGGRSAAIRVSRHHPAGPPAPVRRAVLSGACRGAGRRPGRFFGCLRGTEPPAMDPAGRGAQLRSALHHRGGPGRGHGAGA